MYAKNKRNKVFFLKKKNIKRQTRKRENKKTRKQETGTFFPKEGIVLHLHVMQCKTTCMNEFLVFLIFCYSF